MEAATPGQTLNKKHGMSTRIYAGEDDFVTSAATVLLNERILYHHIDTEDSICVSFSGVCTLGQARINCDEIIVLKIFGHAPAAYCPIALFWAWLGEVLSLERVGRPDPLIDAAAPQEAGVHHIFAFESSVYQTTRAHGWRDMKKFPGVGRLAVAGVAPAK